jgi:hypothetical protein
MKFGHLTTALLILVLGVGGLPSLGESESAAPGLSGLPSVPDGSEVRILRDELQSVLSSGTVKAKSLMMMTPGGRLPPFVRVKVWIGVTEKGAADLLSFSGSVAESGTDVMLEESAGDRVSFMQVMREAYGIKVEFKDAKK